VVLFQPPTVSQSELVAESDDEYQEQDDGWPEQHVDADFDKQARDEATW
jgi:hypothetical protein